MEAEEARINALLDDGIGTGAFDDGTVHVLDGHIAARRAQYTHHLDTQEAVRAHRAAVRVAKATRDAERRHSRLLVLEARLQRIEDNFGAVDAALRGGDVHDSARPRFERLDGPRHLHGYARRSAVEPIDPDFPAAAVRAITPSGND
jgi:hypothetical protein